MKKRFVYLDHAAATPLDPEVERAMKPFWRKRFANPSAIYRSGLAVRQALDEARSAVANILGCSASEVVFVPGGTASDNLAIAGTARRWRREGRHIVTTAIEHHAVLYAVKMLREEDFDVTVVPASVQGLVNPDDIRRALRQDTILVSVMYANNEVGTIQPLAEIAQVVRSFRRTKAVGHAPADAAQLPYLHTDACQAAGYLDLDVRKLGVDMLTANGSKIYGPKMSGILYARRGCRLDPIVAGGGQEGGYWSGTENVPAIVGFAKALELAEQKRAGEVKRLTNLRDYLISRLLREIGGVGLNGHCSQRLPNNVHLSFRDVEGEVLALYLDAEGIAVATGAACASQSRSSSHVAQALGLSADAIRGSIRITLGRQTVKADCDYLVEKMKKSVALLRNLPVHR